ncbi:hypothetical protein O181_042452 [Austropuccinia psidii MF-1]|uniref:Sjogrens syndrome scleroderma autoantigen 1 family protein n=1 Tax=Austropuccinia psidii MF-1 TaxID=1389203 RepID=A0A9Q3HFW2_9BASI|nr:hypothetical protein [Austropuccinia psidii MF-1]
MASPSEVSGILGRYMLQGWTLTDVNCPNLHCMGCPLMRSRTGEEFCARCDGGPAGASSTSRTLKPQAPTFLNPSSSSSNASDDSPATVVTEPSGYITPPTPPLNSLSHPGPDVDDGEDLVPIANPQVLEARRAQSDLASSRIGQLLLKGWVLLDAHCQGPECWGVPLMRTPKRVVSEADGLKRKWCVICEQDWGLDSSRAVGQGVSTARTHGPSTAAPSPLTEPTNIVSASSATKDVIALPASSNDIQSGFLEPDLPTLCNASIPALPVPSDSAVIQIAKGAISEAIKHLSASLVKYAQEAQNPVLLVSTAEQLDKLVGIYKNL